MPTTLDPVLDRAQQIQDIVSRITRTNWIKAQNLAVAWVEVDYHQRRLQEAIATHGLNPNRRPPRLVEPMPHPSIVLSDQVVALEPLGRFPSHQPGQHWGYYDQNGVRIALDADSRNSAIALHQGLMLLLQDPTVRQDLIHCGINQVRIRQDLHHPNGTPMLGYYDGNGVFSLDANQMTPYLAATAAHQVGHAKYGQWESLANQYAGQYRTRNRSLFRQWRQDLKQPLESPEQVVGRAMDVLKRQAPKVHHAVQGYTIRTNPRTPFAQPHDVLSQVTFVKLQDDSERDLARRGMPVSLPREVDDCLSHNAVDVYSVRDAARRGPQPANPPIAFRNLPTAPAGQPTAAAPAQPDAWLRDPTLSQRSGNYTPEFVHRNPLSAMAEGGGGSGSPVVFLL